MIFTTIEITTKDTFISSIATRAKFRRRPPIADYVSDDVQNTYPSLFYAYVRFKGFVKAVPSWLHQAPARDKE